MKDVILELKDLIGPEDDIVDIDLYAMEDSKCYYTNYKAKTKAGKIFFYNSKKSKWERII